MAEDAARTLRAQDYEFLRNRARAQLHAVESPPEAAESGPDLLETSYRRKFERADPSRLAEVPPPEPRRTVREPHRASRAAVAERERATVAAAPIATRRPAPRAYGSRTGPAPAAGFVPSAPPAERRTVRITGQVTPRRQESTASRIASAPDRTAMWAVLLGIFLVIMAVATAHAAPLAHHAPALHAAAPNTVR